MSFKGFGSKLNDLGQEIPDPTPVAAPIKFKRPPTIQELVYQYIGAASRDAAHQGEETFEEADDFEVEDEYDFISPYEEDFDHARNLDALREDLKARRQKVPPRGKSKQDLKEERPEGVSKKAEAPPQTKSEEDSL